MFRCRYVCGPTGHEETGHPIPLLPELEQSFSALVGSCGELGMEGFRRAMLATDTLEDGGGVGGVGCLHPSSPLRHDPSLHYESAESLQLSDTADLCRLSQLRLQSTSDPIILGHDRHLGDDPHEPDVMYTELTSHYRQFSPSGSTGDGGLEPDLSDSSSSESGLESPSSADHWDPMGDSGVSISMDPDGPLPPVTDIFAHRLPKEDFGDMLMTYPNRGLPFSIKTERMDSEEDSMDCSCSPSAIFKTHPTPLSSPSYSSSPSSSSSTSPLLSYTTLHSHYRPGSASTSTCSVNTPAPTTATNTTTTTTTNNSNYHDYTTPTSREYSLNHNHNNINNNGPSTAAAAAERMGGESWLVKESSNRSGLLPGVLSASGGREVGVMGMDGGEKQQQQRKKPGRKKGQVSKVLHLWEFIRDLLSDPNYCPRIISWENEREGVFRVTHSSEVARLWGEKKKNKKTMTYEKLSRSLRYSRKEGYFDALPRDRGYPKKLCFKFGPKSHGWNEYKL